MLRKEFTKEPEKFENSVGEVEKKISEQIDLNNRSADVVASLYNRFSPETRAKYFPCDKDDIVAGKMKPDQIFFPGAEGIYLKAKTYIEANHRRREGEDRQGQRQRRCPESELGSS